MRNLKARTSVLVVLAPFLVVLAAACNEIAGIHEGKPPGSDVACTTVDDCPLPEFPDCATLTACEADLCQYSNELDGKPLPPDKQVVGDCTQIVCDGDGQTRLQAFDGDAEEDGNPCTQDTCVGGNSVHTPQQEVDCYAAPDGTPGPAGTRDIGICKAGVQHCDANFQPVGGCEGATLPGLETCNTPEDEDCDGKKNEEGDGCYCTPESTDSCYGGDQAKAGVGICQLGQCLCNAAGTACETACMGWVPPVAEDCSTPTDDDCDGEDVDPEDGCVCVANSNENCYICDATGKAYAQVPSVIDDCQIPGDDDCDGTAIDSCTGAFAWVKASVQTGSYGSYTRPSGIAVDSSGNVAIVGTLWNAALNQTLNLGGGVLSSPAGASTPGYLFVASYTSTGAHRWSKLLPCASSQTNNDEYTPDVAMAGGNVAITLRGEGYNCDFGSGTTEVATGALVVRLNGATGAFVGKSAVAINDPRRLTIAGAPDGSVAVGGYAYNSQGAFLFALDPMGATKWNKSFGISQYYYGYANNAVRNVAFLDDGAVAFAGLVADSTIDLGGVVLGANNSSVDTRYVGVIDDTGVLRWGKGSPLPTSQLALATAGDELRLVGNGGESYCGPACQAAAVAETLTETEPNDTLAQANAVPAGKFVVKGTLESYSSVADYFAITVPANASLVLETSDANSSTTCAGYMRLTFYNPSGTQITTGYANGINTCARLSGSLLNNLAAGTYVVKVNLESTPAPFSYRLNIKVNGTGATQPMVVTGRHALSIDPADGTSTGLVQLPSSSGATPSGTAIDALGHTSVGATTGITKYNAQGTLLWGQMIPFNNAPPVVATGPDGTIYFAGQIYGNPMINGMPLGTQNGYEVVWGKLAQ